MSIKIYGKETCAEVFTDNCEQEALEQIGEVCDHPAFKDVSISIMPDVHAGAGCVIGFTASMREDKIIPNLIGVDIGCNVRVCHLNDVAWGDLNLERKQTLDRLDAIIRKQIPSGFNAREDIHPMVHSYSELVSNISRISKDMLDCDPSPHLQRLGTLGGGNHFISIEQGVTGTYLLIHSGSRNFGHKVASYFQKKAIANNNHKNKELCYLEGSNVADYLCTMKIAQEYAKLNTYIIQEAIINAMNWSSICGFVTVHNYISDGGTIRKGAVAARAGEEIVIPLNMRDGSLLARGKGNLRWNYSAPHGAGRIMSRSKAKKSLSMKDFQESMKDIYSTCVKEATLDECPMAYKNGTEIEKLLEPTATVFDHLKPIYNYKAN